MSEKGRPAEDLVLDYDGRTVFRQSVIPGSPRLAVPDAPIPRQGRPEDCPGGLWDPRETGEQPSLFDDEEKDS